MLVTQSCPTLCDLTGSSGHGILQTRILEWVAIPFSRGSSLPRDRTPVSCIAGMFFTVWATREGLSPLKSVQSLSHVWLFVTSRAAAHQASLSITSSQSFLKLMSIKSVMPSNLLDFYILLFILQWHSSQSLLEPSQSWSSVPTKTAKNNELKLQMNK